MKKLLLLVVLISVFKLNSYSQCAINPVANYSYVGTSGGNCTYTLNLKLTSGNSSLKWITFVVNGTRYCFRSNGTAFIADNTCGSGTNGVNIGNTPKTATLILTYTIPCNVAPTATFEASQSSTNTAQCLPATSFVFPIPVFPIKIVSFKGFSDEKQININWQTEDEVNFEKFELQK
jgi:hypothetical protein